MRLVAVVGSVFYLGGWAVDLSLVAPGPISWLLLGIRAVVALTVLGAVVDAGADPPRPERLDAGVSVALLVMVVGTCLIIALSPGGIIPHALTVIVILLVLYLFVPLSPARMTVICLAFSLGFVVVALAWIGPSSSELALVGLYLLLVNVFGGVGDRLHQRALRVQFAALATERQSRAQLVREVEARRDAEHALLASENRYRNLFETSPYAIVVHRDGTVLSVNPSAARIVGTADPSELEGRSVLDFIDPGSHALVTTRLRELAEGADHLTAAQVTLRTPQGERIDVEVVSSRAVFEGRPAVQTVLSDIRDRKRLEDELRRLATVDMLTGARNRHAFFLQGEAEIARSRRHRRPLAAVMLDLDRFKQVNDRYGHAVGDDVLAGFGEVCRSLLRTEDLFGRIGGEEFVALLPDVDGESAVGVAARLCSEVERLRVEAEGETVRVTVSAGVTELVAADRGLDDVLRRADEALYVAKRAGRNRVERR